MPHELVRVSPAWLRLLGAADAAARALVTISVTVALISRQPTRWTRASPTQSMPTRAHPRHTAYGRRLLGAAAWAFGVAGLIAALGVANAVVYGVMMLVASLSGACGLVTAWPHRCTLGPRRADPPRLRPMADASLASAAYG